METEAAMFREDELDIEENLDRIRSNLKMRSIIDLDDVMRSDPNLTNLLNSYLRNPLINLRQLTTVFECVLCFFNQQFHNSLRDSANKWVKAQIQNSVCPCPSSQRHLGFCGQKSVMHKVQSVFINELERANLDGKCLRKFISSNHRTIDLITDKRLRKRVAEVIISNLARTYDRAKEEETPYLDAVWLSSQRGEIQLSSETIGQLWLMNAQSLEETVVNLLKSFCESEISFKVDLLESSLVKVSTNQPIVFRRVLSILHEVFQQTGHQSPIIFARLFIQIISKKNSNIASLFPPHLQHLVWLLSEDDPVKSQLDDISKVIRPSSKDRDVRFILLLFPKWLSFLFALMVEGNKVAIEIIDSLSSHQSRQPWILHSNQICNGCISFTTSLLNSPDLFPTKNISSWTSSSPK